MKLRVLGSYTLNILGSVIGLVQMVLIVSECESYLNQKLGIIGAIFGIVFLPLNLMITPLLKGLLMHDWSLFIGMWLSGILVGLFFLIGNKLKS
jgi:hypothetical protein